MLNSNLQNVLKQFFNAVIETRPLVEAVQKGSMEALNSSTADFSKLLPDFAKISVHIMINGVRLEQAIVRTESPPEELLKVEGIVNCTSYLDEVDDELRKLVIENKKFSDEVNGPMMAQFGERSSVVVLELLDKNGLMPEFHRLIDEEISKSMISPLEIASVFTRNNLVNAVSEEHKQAIGDAYDMGHNHNVIPIRSRTVH